MNWNWILAAGIVTAAVVAARRRSQRIASQGQSWAAATDPVAPGPA